MRPTAARGAAGAGGPPSFATRPSPSARIVGSFSAICFAMLPMVSLPWSP